MPLEIVDYKEYLGEDYEDKYVKPPPGGTVPTYVSNHISGTDIPILLEALSGDLSFIAGEEHRNLPFIGLFVKANQSIFVPRGGSDKARDQIIKIICDRM